MQHEDSSLRRAVLSYDEAVERVEETASKYHGRAMRVSHVEVGLCGWMFGLQPHDYMEMGNPLLHWGDGNNPFFVSKNGFVWFIFGSIQTRTFFREFEGYLNGSESEIVSMVIQANKEWQDAYKAIHGQ